MLNSLNNFLFGSGTTGDAAVDQTQASQQGELETKEGDMGWVLVDVAGNGSPSNPEEESRRSSPHPDACCCVRDSANLPSSAAPPASCSCGPDAMEAPEESPSDCGNEQDGLGDLVMYERSSCGPRLASLLGESWIVTPPPCFTGTGNEVELEASPLENLLIEHPSMSVYRRAERTRLLRRREEDDMEDEESENREATLQRARDMVEQRVVEYQQGQYAARRAPRHARPIRACTAVAEQMKVTRFQQRQQQAAVGKQLGRKSLNRSNMARMVQSSCHKQVSARSRVLRPSGCINGRRSQRTL